MSYDLSNEMRAAITSLAAVGNLTHRQIAVRFGVSVHTVERIVSGIQNTPRRCQRKLTDAQIDQAIAMRDGGMRNHDIAAHFGVSDGTMSRWISIRRTRRIVFGE